MCSADNLITFLCRLYRNLSSLTSWNPQGLYRFCLTFSYLSIINVITVFAFFELRFCRGADKSLARPDWKNNWKVATFSPTRRSLLSRRPGWTDKLLIFFGGGGGLQKLEFGRCSLFPSWSGWELISTPVRSCLINTLGVDWICLAFDRDKWWDLLKPAMDFIVA